MQVNSGGLTYDNVGVDYGNTLYALAESPLDARVLWAGSNDGLLHVTRDGGKKWTDVTENLRRSAETWHGDQHRSVTA